MNNYSLEQVENKLIGAKGTPDRDAYDMQVKVELVKRHKARKELKMALNNLFLVICRVLRITRLTDLLRKFSNNPA